MARETKAQREVRELKEAMERTTVAKSTYVNRMMAVLARATKQNFELDVSDTSNFLVTDRNDPNVYFFVEPVYSDSADVELYELEQTVEWKEQAAAEAERRANVRAEALRKVNELFTEEERKLLNL